MLALDLLEEVIPILRVMGYDAIISRRILTTPLKDLTPEERHIAQVFGTVIRNRFPELFELPRKSE